VHIVELDSGTTKSELRGHDNVVEAAVFVPVPCLPAIRELLGQKVPSYFLPVIIALLSSSIASGSAERGI
jgi:platelet-activating factor acetylhydrolase IB subunit alpha